MKLNLAIATGLILTSTVSHAGALLATCEGQDAHGINYLIEIERSYGRKLNGSVYRYESINRNDKLVLINGPIPLYDDIFDDEGIIHHLIDEDASYEDPDGAQIHISYQSRGTLQADAYIRIRSWSDLPNYPDDYLKLTDAGCNFNFSSPITK